MNMDSKRRSSRKEVGIGPTTLASLPAPVITLSAPAWNANGSWSVFFVGLSQAVASDSVQHYLFMSGAVEVLGSRVSGGGSYNHVDIASPPPKTMLSAGRWDTKRLLNLMLVRTEGAYTAGIVEIQINLIQPTPTPSVIPATLKVVYNPYSQHLLPGEGENEGYILTIPGAPFGSFAPPELGKGVTIFTGLHTNAKQTAHVNSNLMVPAKAR